MKYDFIEIQVISGFITLFITVDESNYEQVKQAIRKAIDNALLIDCGLYDIQCLIDSNTYFNFIANARELCVWVQIAQWKDHEPLMDLFEQYRD